MAPLLIVGTGGFGRETAAAVRADPEGPWHVAGFLDDDPAHEGRLVAGVRVLGPSEAVADHPDAHVVVCTGSPRDFASRYRIVRRLGLDPRRYATVIHPSVSLGEGTIVGRGTVVLANSVATCDVLVGSHVACMPHVTLTHDDEIGDFVTVAAGVRLGGSALVQRGAYLGAGAVIRENVVIGDCSLIGAGSLVLEDVPEHCIAYGSPARVVRSTRPDVTATVE